MTESDLPEIYSEFFRIKHRLMDYDENLRDSIANIRMLMALGLAGASRLRVQTAKAQKHVALVLDLGIACGAIRNNGNPEELAHAERVAKGYCLSIDDFERAQKFFRDEYQRAKFYDVTISKDNRPAVVKRYGSSI